MSCPFKHLWASENAPSRNQSSDLAEASKPAHASEPSNPAEEIKTAEINISKTATCPMGFGSGREPSASSPAASAAPPATCPLGFGSTSGPRLSNLHCIICKSFLYDCVKTNCGHFYCRFCISHFHDCPACGADITSNAPAPENQAVVEEFLSAHAGDTSIWRLEGTESKLESSSDAIKSTEYGSGKAGFLLQIGLRAFSGGNLESAEHRLEQCMAQLHLDLQAKSSGASAVSSRGNGYHTGNFNDAETFLVDLKSQMGAVAGCLGDCARAGGDIEKALQKYEQSAALLQNCCKANTNRSDVFSSGTPEGKSAQSSNEAVVAAMQALSVTLNKIGELWHLQGNLPSALEKYEEALAIRQNCWEAAQGAGDGEGDEGGVTGGVNLMLMESGLDVAVSEVKVADALRGLGRENEAEKHEDAAKIFLELDWVKGLGADEGGGDKIGVPAPLLRKLGALEQIVQTTSGTR